MALSPDGSRVAYGHFTARTGDGPGGSDIVVAAVAAPDADRTVLVPRDRPGMLLAAPCWAPDGTALVFEAVGLSATGTPAIGVEWVAADGTGRRPIAESGRYPSFAPDGRSVLYVRARPTGDALWEQPLDGSAGREILPESQFIVLAYPRYRPDGGSIGFAGVSADPALPKLPVLPTLRPAFAGGRAVAPPAPGRPRRVLAHGFPATPFVVPPSGADPHPAAPLAVDDAAIAWSPDGGWLAVGGATGLDLVDVGSGAVQRVTENGSFGAIDWR